MNFESYIRSGILESYALGLGTPAERAEVERNIAQYPVLAAELKAIEDSLAAYAQAHAIAPPDGLKSKILEKIESEMKAPTPEPTPDPPSSEGGSGGGWTLKSLLPWFIAGIAVALGVALWTSKTEYREQQALMRTMEQQLKDCKSDSMLQQQLRQDMAFINDPATRRIDMLGDVGGQLSVYLNASQQAVFATTARMKPLPANQDYQLWVIVEGNPNPVPLEVFQPGSDPLALVPVSFREKVQAFAVSLEPKGGSPDGKPTQVLMIGALS